MKTTHMETIAKIDAATAKREAALDSFARAIMDLRPILAEARGLPLALGPHISHVCDGLVDAGVAKRIDVGSRVMRLKFKDYGVVTGWADDRTEVVVKWDGGNTSIEDAGKRETRGGLAVVG